MDFFFFFLGRTLLIGICLAAVQKDILVCFCLFFSSFDSNSRKLPADAHRRTNAQVHRQTKIYKHTRIGSHTHNFTDKNIRREPRAHTYTYACSTHHITSKHVHIITTDDMETDRRTGRESHKYKYISINLLTHKI